VRNDYVVERGMLLAKASQADPDDHFGALDSEMLVLYLGVEILLEMPRLSRECGAVGHVMLMTKMDYP
jgi:hypothetical protein